MRGRLISKDERRTPLRRQIAELVLEAEGALLVVLEVLDAEEEVVVVVVVVVAALVVVVLLVVVLLELELDELLAVPGRHCE